MAGRSLLMSLVMSLAIAFRPLGKLNVGYISHIVVKSCHTRGAMRSYRLLVHFRYYLRL